MAMSLQPFLAVFMIVLVITMMIIVRQLSVAVVSNFGVGGGLVALASLFGAGYLLGD